MDTLDASLIFEKLSRADATSLESWLLDRLDSVEAAVKSRCDALESKLCDLSAALHEHDSGLQQQVDALQAKLETTLDSFQDDAVATKDNISSLAEGLKVCGQGYESLQASVNELWRLVAIDRTSQLADRGVTVGLAPHLERLIDTVARTCSDISQLSEKGPASRADSERPRAPEGLLRSRSSKLLPGQPGAAAERPAQHAPSPRFPNWPRGPSPREAPRAAQPLAGQPEVPGPVVWAPPAVRREVSPTRVQQAGPCQQPRQVLEPALERRFVRRDMPPTFAWQGPPAGLANQPWPLPQPGLDLRSGVPQRPMAHAESGVATVSRPSVGVLHSSGQVVVGADERLALV